MERMQFKWMTRWTVERQEEAEEVLVSEGVDSPARATRAEGVVAEQGEACLLILPPYFLRPVGLAG